MNSENFIQCLLLEKEKLFKYIESIDVVLSLYGYQKEENTQQAQVDEVVEEIETLEVLADVPKIISRIKKPKIVVTPKKLRNNTHAEEKKSVDDVNTKREFLLSLVKNHGKYFVVNELVDLYCEEKGRTSANENFARNSVYNFCTNGVLKRIPNVNPYTYGMKEWFTENGNIIDKYK